MCDSNIRITTLILAIAFLVFPFSSAVSSQKRTSEEAQQEAGKIVTEAERKVGEAYKTSDRKLVVEAERAVAEAFVKAIDLWREAGNDTRLIAGVEELTRIYSVNGDYQQAVDRLKFEANYWMERGDLKQQIRMLLLLGLRQWQMKNDEASIETLQQVTEMSRGAGLYSSARNALEQLVLVYTRLGRTKDAEAARAKAKELWEIREPAAPPAAPLAKAQPITIPAQWVDLPSAPMAAEYRDVKGENQAVLVNRSTKGIEMLMFGCVAVDENNKTRVLYSLSGVGLTHGGIRPGFYYQPFAMLNGPLNRWTDEKMGCEGAAKMAVIEVMFDDRSGWKADGKDSVVR